MKKICIVCGREWNDWFLRFLGFIFGDDYEFETCSDCRKYSRLIS